MSGLDHEYAILLPNGQLLTNHTGCDHSSPELPPNPFSYAALFGMSREVAPERVQLFATAEAAQKVADQLRAEARKVGVDDLLVRVVGRVCGPFVTPNEGEQLARQFLDYIANEVES